MDLVHFTWALHELTWNLNLQIPLHEGLYFGCLGLVQRGYGLWLDRFLLAQCLRDCIDLGQKSRFESTSIVPLPDRGNDEWVQSPSLRGFFQSERGNFLYKSALVDR